MIRFLLIQVLLFTGCIVGPAQTALYKEAIKNGLNEKGVYCIKNPKKKTVTEEKMRAFLLNKGYIVGNSVTQNANIYGNVMSIIKSMEFVSPEGLTAYMFNRLNESKFSMSQLSGNGTAFLAKRQEIKQDAFFYIKKYEVVYERINDILWSGNINKAGLINGKGVGIAKMGSQYVYINGTFSNGLPMENCLVKRIGAAISTERGSSEEFMGVYSKTILENAKIIDAKLLEAFDLQKELWYREDSQKLETAFQNALTLNDNYYKGMSSQYGNAEEFVAIYEKLNYDPNNLLPKAKEIRNVYTTLHSRFQHYAREKYWGSRLVVGFCWWDDFEKKDRTVIDDALRVARLGKAESKYFKKFYSQIENELNETKSEFEKKISKQKFAFRNELEDRERRHKQYMQNMCDNCKIDGSRTTFPEGYVEGYKGIIINTPNRSEKKGKIVLINGVSTSWEYIFENNRTYIKTDGFVTGDFDTIGEMMEALIKQCKDTYCR